MVEDLGKHHHEKGTDEVDSGDGDVETVGLLVHPWAQVRNSDKKSELNENESNALNLAAALSKTDKHGLDKEVHEPWNDEPISRGLELYIQESPFVEGNWVGVEDIGRVLVHSDGTLSKADDLGRGPSQDANHSEHGQDGEYDETSRVALSQFPEAEQHHLRKTDEDYPKQNALEHGLPAIAEVQKLVALQLAGLDQAFANELES